MMTLLAGATKKIELVPSALIIPTRQAVPVAKQTASLDRLPGGRLRLGIGVGGDPAEFGAMGADLSNRGARCEEQMALLKRLWTEETFDFEGRWHKIFGAGINPLPTQKPIPMWIGPSSVPAKRIRHRISALADGWFVLASPKDYPEIRDDIHRAAPDAGRDPTKIGAEAGVALVGPREHEWQRRVAGWSEMGLTHLCLRTLGGGLAPGEHIDCMRAALTELPGI